MTPDLEAGSLQDVEVERDGHERVRLEIMKSERDRLVHPYKVLRIIGRRGDDHRSTEFAEKRCLPFGDTKVATFCGPEPAATVPARFAELLYPLEVHSGYVVPGAKLKSLKYTSAHHAGAQRTTDMRPKCIAEILPLGTDDLWGIRALGNALRDGWSATCTEVVMRGAVYDRTSAG